MSFFQQKSTSHHIFFQIQPKLWLHFHVQKTNYIKKILSLSPGNITRPYFFYKVNLFTSFFLLKFPSKNGFKKLNLDFPTTCLNFVFHLLSIHSIKKKIVEREYIKKVASDFTNVQNKKKLIYNQEKFIHLYNHCKLFFITRASKKQFSTPFSMPKVDLFAQSSKMTAEKLFSGTHLANN